MVRCLEQHPREEWREEQLPGQVRQCRDVQGAGSDAHEGRRRCEGTRRRCVTIAITVATQWSRMIPAVTSLARSVA